MDGCNTILSYWVSAYFQGRTVSFRDASSVYWLDFLGVFESTWYRPDVFDLMEFHCFPYSFRLPKGEGVDSTPTWDHESCLHWSISVHTHPIGIFTYIYQKLMINVGKYNIHGSYGICFHIYTV